MKISIVTAVFNGGNSIASTLQSVAQQDYDAIEHIVIDGGSSDSTMANVRANGNRIAHLISESDGGVYDAFNKGLRCATGDAIAFLNCGDTYTSASAVSKIVAALSGGGVQAAFADVLIVDNLDQSRVIRRYSSRWFSPPRMSYGIMPAHPTLFLCREVYRQVGEYDIGFEIAADFELCLRAFCTMGIRYCYLEEALVRMPRGGISNRGWRSKWTITHEMYRACASNRVSTNMMKLCLRFPLKLFEMINVNED